MVANLLQYDGGNFMKRILSILLIGIIIISGFGAYGEIGIENSLRSYILADFETGEILEEYNIDEVVEIASISKLMSYLVVMDQISKGNGSLEDRIIIDEDTTRIKGSTFNLKPGEVFTVRELLDASMVVSANDATYALAKYIAGTEENFVTLMNVKSLELGLRNAVFYNSTGMPIGEKGLQNIMTTKEIFQLSKYIIENYPEILQVSKKQAIEVVSRDFFQNNTNPLLREISEVDGLKTGFTNKAGYCYVSTFNMEGKADNTEDLRLISIVMGAKGLKERNDMARILVQYGLDNYSNKIFFDREKVLDVLYLPKANISEVEIFPENGFTKLIKNDEDIAVNISLDENINLPIKKNEKIGAAKIGKDGQVIFETNILIKEDVKKAKWYVLIWRYLVGLLEG